VRARTAGDTRYAARERAERCRRRELAGGAEARGARRLEEVAADLRGGRAGAWIGVLGARDRRSEAAEERDPGERAAGRCGSAVRFLESIERRLDI
jgi:hypothetical protein